MTVWSSLHAQIHQTLRSRSIQVSGQPLQPLLPKGHKLLVGVSGGQDSQCLLRLLVDLQDKWHWQLHCVHCDHRWPADLGNAQFVAQCTEAWKIPCSIKVAEHPPQGEAAARQWRYQVFETVAREIGCTHVVTAHTASDRAETLLYNLVRGSGTDGLQALGWQRSLSPTAPDISLVRPLLAVTRAETGQFCQDFNIPVWDDRTNADRAYARNRMRLDVLPLLREQFNPQVETTLAQTAEILAAEVAYLEAAAKAILDQCMMDGRIQRRSLRQTPLALQRRVIRQVLKSQLGAAPQFEHVEKVVALLGAPHRSQTDPLPGGAIAVVDDPWVIFKFPADTID